MDANFAGGYPYAKLLTFELKRVKKVRPGAEKGQFWEVEGHPGFIESLPGAMESILREKRLLLQLLKFILEPWRLTLEL